MTKHERMIARVRAALEFMVAEYKRVGYVQDDNTLPREARLPSITCPQCGWTSYNANDIREKYCANCQQFHEFLRPSHGAQ